MSGKMSFGSFDLKSAEKDKRKKCRQDKEVSKLEKWKEERSSLFEIQQVTDSDSEDNDKIDGDQEPIKNEATIAINTLAQTPLFPMTF